MVTEEEAQAGNAGNARDREKHKDAEQKAADIAYTVNHSISCGTTDIFVQPIAAVAATTLAHEDILPKQLHWVTHLFEHDHDHGHAHGHSHAHGHEAHALEHAPDATKWQRVWARVKHEMRWKNLAGNLGHWATGEVAGDVGGILPTIWVQRAFPGFMEGMRRVLEPVAGGFFRSGAARDARHWAKKHGVAENSPEAKHKEEALYQHELSHLPQAVMWNAFSIPINYATQWGMARMKGERFGFGTFLIGKTFGTVFSNTVLIGGRGMAPELFNHWDRVNSRYVIKPTMTAIGGLLGEGDLAKIHEKAEARKEGRDETWQARVDRQADSPDIPSLKK